MPSNPDVQITAIIVVGVVLCVLIIAIANGLWERRECAFALRRDKAAWKRKQKEAPRA